MVRWGRERWAQIPRGFSGDHIPDEFIFHPEWNRELVNGWWATLRQSPREIVSVDSVLGAQFVKAKP